MLDENLGLGRILSWVSSLFVVAEFLPLCFPVLGNALTNKEGKVKVGRVGSRVDVCMLAGLGRSMRALPLMPLCPGLKGRL